MTAGFRVDIAALDQAARGVRGVLAQIAGRAVSSIAPPHGAAGDERLDGAIAGFCERWERGVAGLAADGAAISDRLDRCAAAYHHVDHRVRSGMISGAGADPGPS